MSATDETLGNAKPDAGEPPVRWDRPAPTTTALLRAAAAAERNGEKLLKVPHRDDMPEETPRKPAATPPPERTSIPGRPAAAEARPKAAPVAEAGAAAPS
ncbi:MAG: hypothetical protein K2X11_21590, partial [Acetobacteraceae bacterium]|nr:hypothetical protein [Acetobacteraceae bacterium]